MSELEDAIRDQRARVRAHVAPEEFPDGGESYHAALARLERLVRYAALWEAHGWTTCADEECSLEAEIAEAVK